MLIPDLIDLPQATRSDVRGATVRRHSEQITPKFDRGNGDDLVGPSPGLGRSLFGHNFLYRAPRNKGAPFLYLDLDEQPNAILVGVFRNRLREERETGCRHAAFQELIKKGTQLGMFANQAAE